MRPHRAEAQSLYVVHSTYRRNAHAQREAEMVRHLQYVRSNRDLLRWAGPLLADDGRTATGSMAIVEAPDRAAADEFIANEPFQRAGMFGHIDIFGFASAIGDRQVCVVPSAERQMYLCRLVARSGVRGGEDWNLALQREDASVRLLEAGPLLVDDASDIVGSLFILEVCDRSVAERFLEREVQRQFGLKADAQISRWRFGQGLSA